METGFSRDSRGTYHTLGSVLIRLSDWLRGAEKLPEASVPIGLCGHMFAQPHLVGLVGLSPWHLCKGRGHSIKAGEGLA